MRESVLEKALSTLAGEGGEFLPQPLSSRFCDHVYDGSELLSLIPKTPMKTKTLTIPVVSDKMQVYWQNLEKSEPPRSAFQTESKQLDAETWMCWVDFSDQLRDDIKAGPYTVEMLLAKQYSKAMAYFLELALVLGDTAHANTTTTDPGIAGETWYLNAAWYNRDPRLMWNGLYTLALASGVNFTATFANALLAYTNDDVQANATQPTRMSTAGKPCSGAKSLSISCTRVRRCNSKTRCRLRPSISLVLTPRSRKAKLIPWPECLS